MVKSGLVGRVEVAPERLATHLLLASLTFAAELDRHPDCGPRGPKPRRRACAAGAGAGRRHVAADHARRLVAGARAGLDLQHLAADGRPLHPADRTSDEHRAPVAQLHRQRRDDPVRSPHGRLCAAGAGALALGQRAAPAGRAPRRAAARRPCLGLVGPSGRARDATLLLVLPEGRIPPGPALAHQAFAMFVLGMATVHARRIGASQAA